MVHFWPLKMERLPDIQFALFIGFIVSAPIARYTREYLIQQNLEKNGSKVMVLAAGKFFYYFF